LEGVALGLLLTFVFTLIVACFLGQSGLVPADADAKPGRLEIWMANASLNVKAHGQVYRSPHSRKGTDRRAGYHGDGEKRRTGP
jgi:hypothetical protein